jgi:hypothetical protein
MTKNHPIYMRVSAMRQDTASQEPKLRRWLESPEGDFCCYRDTHASGSMDRPGFRQLMKEIELGRVDTLVVLRLDRLAGYAETAEKVSRITDATWFIANRDRERADLRFPDASQLESAGCGGQTDQGRRSKDQPPDLSVRTASGRRHTFKMGKLGS